MSPFLVVAMACAVSALVGLAVWVYGRSRRARFASGAEDAGATVLFVSSTLFLFFITLEVCRLLLVNWGGARP